MTQTGGDGPLPDGRVPDGRRRNRRTVVVLLAVAVAVLVLLGVLALVVTRGGRSSEDAQGGTDEPEPSVAAPAGVGTPGATPPGPASVAPPIGSCLRMDAAQPSLSTAVDCGAPVGHFRVLWTGGSTEQPPFACDFRYWFSGAAHDFVVCLHPVLDAGRCYSIPVGDAAPSENRGRNEIATWLNGNVDAVACGGPPRHDGEKVLRMVTETEGADGATCPPEASFVVSDPVARRAGCLAEG